MTHVEDSSSATLQCNNHFQQQVECPSVDLLSPLELHGVTIPTRIALSPMCQYCAKDGLADDWHLVHLGSRAAGGASLVMTEAAAVSPEGRITPGDLGIWSDEHAARLERIVRFIDSQGALAGIQIAHAGRKASCHVPWEGGGSLAAQEDAWPVLGPSPIPFAAGSPIPREATQADIDKVIEQFVAATRRAVQVGFRVIEIHAAHGYLLHSFLSRLSNQRADAYGGSLENRMRLLLQVVHAVKQALTDEQLLFVRISATDWVEGGWDIEQSVELARRLKTAGVDLVDCSSGALVPIAKIPLGKGYQVGFASRIRHETGILTAAVGMITEPEHANEIITSGDADLVFIGREMLREPYCAHRAHAAMNEEPRWPLQYGYAVKKRVSKG